MLSLDKQVNLTCIETDKVAKGKIVRIQGNRVDVALDQGGLLISLYMKNRAFMLAANQALNLSCKASNKLG